MIIGPDSALRRLSYELDERQARFFDGMRLAIEIADVAQSRLEGNLSRLVESGFDSDSDFSLTCSCLSDAWSVVDSLHRIKKLLDHFPRLVRPNRSTILRGFRSEADKATRLRDWAQHLYEKIPDAATEQWPVLGTVTWWTTASNATTGTYWWLAPGRIAGGGPRLQLPGRAPLPPIDLVTLTVGKHDICLTDAMKRLRLLAKETEHILDGDEHRHLQSMGSDLLVEFELNIHDKCFSPRAVRMERRHAGTMPMAPNFEAPKK